MRERKRGDCRCQVTPEFLSCTLANEGCFATIKVRRDGCVCVCVCLQEKKKLGRIDSSAKHTRNLTVLGPLTFFVRALIPKH